MNMQVKIKVLTVVTSFITWQVVKSVTCPENGVHYSTLNYCYWFLSTPESYSNQRTACQSNGGDLASIPNISAQQFIENQLGTSMQSAGSYVFFGFESNYYWITDGPVFQTWYNWGSNEPQFLKLYVTIDPGNGFLWKSGNTLSLFGANPTYTGLCYKDLSVGSCPAGGVTYATLNVCYWYSSIAREHSGLQMACQAQNGNLAIIPDQAAQTFIENTFGSAMSSDGRLVMTGIYMPTTKLWPPSWTNWDSANSQPDGGSVGVLDPGNSFRWRDESTYCGFGCSVQYPALCYGGASSFLPDPTTTPEETTVTITTPESTTTTPEATTITTTPETTTIPDTTTTPETTTAPETTTETTTPSETTTIPETTTTALTTTTHTTGIITTVTTAAPANTGCQCTCTSLPPSILNSTEAFAAYLEEKIKEIQRSLTVDKKTISANIRKLTSATDSRASAKQVGGIGIAFLAFVLGGIILPDLISLIQFFKSLKR